MGNAIKFTPPEGRIDVTATLVPDLLYESDQPVPAIQIAISDNGIGIKPEDQERVFETFTQVDSSFTREQEGTGLGLTLTKKLVESHGGKIWVESEGIEGKGSSRRPDSTRVRSRTSLTRPSRCSPLVRML